MSSDAVRASIDAGDVAALRRTLSDDPTGVTALVSAPDIQDTSPLIGRRSKAGSRLSRI